MGTGIDIGSGTPIVLIPGVQGRWEWMRAAVRALSRRFRVIAFTLAGEWTSGERFDSSVGFDTFVGQVGRVMDRAAVREAVICGVSYGGLIALRFAAQHPDRVRALVLVSTPPPDYRPDAVVQRYVDSPWIMAPLFFVRAVQRGLRELMSALPTWRARASAVCGQALAVVAAPMVPGRMSHRMRLLRDVDLVASARRCPVPVLVITGEPHLDRVVPVDSTLRYRELLPHVTVRRLERTGHLGVVLRPEAFADLIEEFVNGLDRRRDDRSLRAG